MNLHYHPLLQSLMTRVHRLSITLNVEVQGRGDIIGVSNQGFVEYTVSSLYPAASNMHIKFLTSIALNQDNINTYIDIWIGPGMSSYSQFFYTGTDIPIEAGIHNPQIIGDAFDSSYQYRL
jgi:hypothetical protein